MTLSCEPRVITGGSGRLDAFLSSLGLPGMHSRSAVEKLIERGLVTVDGKKVRKSMILCGSETICVTLPPPEPSHIVPTEIAIDVVYEDEYLIAVNKPAGLTVHPAPGHKTDTLANGLLARWPMLPDNGGRPGIVHRLDKDTSGLLLVAKTPAVLAALGGMFKNREVKKTYLAITAGCPDQIEGHIDLPLKRASVQRKKIVTAPDGRQASTNWRILESWHWFALMAAQPLTGRTHQIRVHLAAIGCPVLADFLYGSPARTAGLVPVHLRQKAAALENRMQRQALHAARLVFIHPFTGHKMQFCAPLPQDFLYTLNLMRQSFPK